MNTNSSYLRYWGKLDREDSSRFHRAAYHCLDVCAVADAILSQPNRFHQSLNRNVLCGLPASSRSALLFLISAHDLGKFSKGFQSLCEDEALLERLNIPLTRRRDGTLLRKGYDSRHDALSKLFLEEIVLLALFENGAQLVRQLSEHIEAIAGHHGAPVDQLVRKRVILRDELSPEIRDDIVRFAEDLAAILGGTAHINEGLHALATSKESSAGTWFLSGFTSLCDWIGSAESHFEYQQEAMSLRDYWENHAQPQAQAAVNALGLGLAKPHPQGSFAHLYPTFSTPSPMQAIADNLSLGTSTQLFIIEDLTGSGKTEAAMVLAARLLQNASHGSIYVALPTKATANGLFERIGPIASKLFESNDLLNLVLTHSDAASNEVFRSLITNKRSGSHYDHGNATDLESSVGCSAWLLDNRKKSFLADLGVGTIDQALLGVLPARYMTMRLLGLAGGVLILDEVHAYDAYTSTLLERLLGAMAALGTHVILLSATLTNQQREGFANAFLHGFTQNDDLQVQWEPEAHYPLLTHIAPEYLHDAPSQAMVEYPTSKELQEERCLPFTFLRSTEEVDEVVQTTVASAHSVAWIRNTVDTAIDAYEQMCEAHGEDNVLILHSRFTRADRNYHERRVLKHFGKDSTPAQRQGKVVVATQVIEQSLDLDFDELISDLAPIDLLIQRAGRWRRHARTAEGQRLQRGAQDQRADSRVHVLCPDHSSVDSQEWLDELLPYTSLIYSAPEVLWRTAQSLSTAPTLLLPQEARSRLEYVYNPDVENDPELPQELKLASSQERQNSEIDRFMGEYRSLRIERTPYTRKNAQWDDEDKIATRLIEEQRTLRLVRVDASMNVRPWEGAQWNSGDIQIPRRRAIDIEKVVLPNELMGLWHKALEKLVHEMPDRGKFVDTVPILDGSDQPILHTRNHRNETVEWRYSSTTGLRHFL